MTTPLISWADLIARYPDLANKGDATVANSYFIPYGVSELEAMLASRFTVPFSTNNVTAKDLAIDLVFSKVWRPRDIEKASEVYSYVSGRCADLISGKAVMMLSDGTYLDGGIGDMLYSTTEGEHPVFGNSPPELWSVNSQSIISEESARGRY